MPKAARAALAAWSSPVKSRRSASPPNFSSPPPCEYASSSRAANVEFMTSVTSSAPALPRLESRSDMAVKPEMSTNASVPSTSTQRRSGWLRSHSSVSLGTNETSSAGEVSTDGGAGMQDIVLQLSGGSKKDAAQPSGADRVQKSHGAVRSATAPAWELHQLFDGCPSVLAYQDGSWMVSVQGRTAAGDSLDEVLTQALERRRYGLPAASAAPASA